MKITDVSKEIKKEIAKANRKAKLALEDARSVARDTVRNKLRSVIKKSSSKLPDNVVASRKGGSIEVFGRGMYNVKKLEFFVYGRKAMVVYPDERQALVFKSARLKSFTDDHPNLKYKKTGTAGKVGKSGMSRAVFTAVARHRAIPPRLGNIGPELQEAIRNSFLANGFKIDNIKVELEKSV